MKRYVKIFKRFNHYSSILKEEYVPSYEGLRRLKEEGILKEHPKGGHVIESSPKNLDFSFPLSLKDKPINLWNDEDRIWLNT